MLEGDLLGGAQPAAALLDPGGVAGQVRLAGRSGSPGGVGVFVAFGNVMQDQGIGQVPVIVEAAGVLEHFDVGRGQQVIGRGPAQHGPQIERDGQAVDTRMDR